MYIRIYIYIYQVNPRLTPKPTRHVASSDSNTPTAMSIWTIDGQHSG